MLRRHEPDDLFAFPFDGTEGRWRKYTGIRATVQQGQAMTFHLPMQVLGGGCRDSNAGQHQLGSSARAYHHNTEQAAAVSELPHERRPTTQARMRKLNVIFGFAHIDSDVYVEEQTIAYVDGTHYLCEHTIHDGGLGASEQCDGVTNGTSTSGSPQHLIHKITKEFILKSILLYFNPPRWTQAHLTEVAMVLKDTKRPPLECCKWLTVEVIKTVCSTSVPVIDGLGRVNPSRKDGEGVSP